MVEHGGVPAATALDRVSEAVVVVGSDGRITYRNARAESLVGATVGEPFGDRLGSAASEAVRAAVAATPPDADAPPQVDERVVVSEDPTADRTYEVRVYPEADGATVYATETDAAAASGHGGLVSSEQREETGSRPPRRGEDANPPEGSGRTDGGDDGEGSDRERDGTGGGVPESVGLLETLVANTSEAVYVKDADGVYQFLNEAGADLLGVEPAAAVGRTDEELFGPETGDAVSELDSEVLSSGESVTYETTREFDGERHTFLTEKHPYVEDGAVAGLVGVSRDITERVRRERRLERQERLFERLQAVADIGVWDYESETVSISEGTAHILGLSETKELTTGDARAFVHEADRERLVGTVRAAVEEGTEFDVETRIVRTSGETRDVRVWGEPATDGRGVRGVVQDVTKRKERERRLRRQNDRLDEFASVISHDLRNPLGVAQGHLELLSRDTDHESVGEIATALERIEAIVEDTLTLARRGETVGQREPVALREVAETCWRLTETGDATLVVEGDPTVRADRDRVRQILENLFRNAAEHGGSVTVRVGRDEDRLYVADDGPGVPPDDRERVFEPGYSDSTEGTGFGLAIVRRIAEAHGWNVRLTESADGGARFEFCDVTFAEPVT